MSCPLFRVFTAIAAAVGLSASGAAQSPPSIEVGEPFPEIVLPSMDGGEPMSIRRFRGQRVVLHVFASW